VEITKCLIRVPPSPLQLFKIGNIDSVLRTVLQNGEGLLTAVLYYMQDRWPSVSTIPAFFIEKVS